MKLFKLLSSAFITTVVLFSMLSCDPFDLSSDCDETKEETITKEFLFSLEIKYKDNLPFDKDVDFTIYKKRCQGNYYNTHVGKIHPDEYGVIEPEAIMYSLSNKKDFVYVEFTIRYTPIYPNSEVTKVISREINYKSAQRLSNADDEVIVKLKTTLPINSDGTD